MWFLIDYKLYAAAASYAGGHSSASRGGITDKNPFFDINDAYSLMDAVTNTNKTYLTLLHLIGNCLILEK